MTRIWTGTADVVSGYTTVVLTGDPLTAANCPVDATIVLAGATYFVAEADYPTMTVELTRAYEGTDGTVSAEIDPMTPLTGSVVALAKSIADYNAQLALLEARGLGLFYRTLGMTGADDPEPGNIARNAASWSDVTALYIDVLDATEANIDQSGRIDALAAGDSVVIESLSTGAYAAFTLSGAVAMATGWRTVPVAYDGGAGIVADEEFVRIVGLKRGPAGANGTNGTNGANGADGTDGADGDDGVGVPTGGSAGQVLKKASGTDYDTAWGNPGPGTTTDNTLARFDGTTGALQVSAVEVDDAGNISAFGGQIKFPATQNASADANTLDDYEEGTFTPGLTFGGGSTGLTFSSRGGHYTKIGNLVTVSIFLILSAKGSSTGATLITNLPFPCKTGARGALAAGYAGGMSGLTAGLVFGIGSGNSFVDVLLPGTTGANVQVGAGSFSNTTEIQCGGSYLTD